MKLLTFAAATYGFLLKECLNSLIFPTEHLCDFALNPHSSIKPVLKEASGKDEEVWCSVHNPSLTDYVAMVCPKKKGGDYTELETVPANCFTKHLYSPYDSEENEKDMELLELDPKLSFNRTFNDFVLKLLVIPGYYKHNKTIYCRCDNRKTKKGEDQEKIEEGKVGLVKIVLNKKEKKPRGIDFTETDELEQTGIVQNGNDKLVKVKENETIHFKFNSNQKLEIKECENVINMKYGFLQEHVLNFRFPAVFLSSENCTITVIESAKTPVRIIIKTQKTENIDGCDFTKPSGEGDYQDGFALEELKSNEKICTIHIGSSKKKISAGIKCPYKLTPTYCFRHVLYEKDVNGVKSYHPFLLTDVLGTLDVEFYSNAQEGSYIIGLPTNPQKYSVVRCVCEHNGKAGIMELRIASSSGWAFLSLTLLLLLIALLSAC
nr:s47 [Plasmodium simium]